MCQMYPSLSSELQSLDVSVLFCPRGPITSFVFVDFQKKKLNSMQRVCKVTFGEGPLGLSIYSTGEPPVRVREPWSCSEKVPGVELFNTKVLQMHDIIETYVNVKKISELQHEIDSDHVMFILFAHSI